MSLVSDTTAAAIDHELREYVRLREEADEANAEKKEADKRLEDQKQKLWDFMESAGLRTVNHELGRVTKSAIIKAAVHDQEAATRSMEELGLLETMTRREWAKANLNAFVKELVASGEELPDGLDTYVDRRLTFTRTKGSV